MPLKKYDICIIGAGSAGLTMAAVSANLGHKVALIERDKMGGDCLNYGCVPSKALLAAAKKELSFNQAMEKVEQAIASIAPHDSQNRFEGMGVDVYRHQGRFISPTILKAGEDEIQAKRFVIATGSAPFVPPIKGLADTPYLTNETIFKLQQQPKHLVIIGGGAIGLEMAFAFKKLGSEVTVVEGAPNILFGSEPEAVAQVQKTLKDLNIQVYENAKVESTKATQSGVAVDLNDNVIEGSHLLVATGRQANFENLDLAKAKVETAKKIKVNNKLQTSQKHIYAIGDCASQNMFTHHASFEASVVIKRLLFGMFWHKNSQSMVPKVLYTHPEVASVGLTQQQASQKHGAQNVRCVHIPLSENDRAVCEGETDGFIKAVLNRKGYILGVTIVSPHAGELITPWTTLMTHKRKVADLSAVTVPYPTYSEINKKVASEFYKDTFYGKKVQRLSQLLFKLLG
ncbi:MAG: dihydrolipoamide dehydrogenase [Magnetococcales bacterium]|nr:dihydrolipoamide dehydrogenase [Magnetococcales bacterium]|tara:strand:+ start:3070 stop:4440 length:1371 start_codon:yes stop_codon:yes gene_type:complete